VEKSQLDEFGEILVSNVRDKTIGHWERVVMGTMKDSESQQIFRELNKLDVDTKNLIQSLVYKVTDTTLHYLLWTIEQNEGLDVTLNQRALKNLSDGLAGELYTEDGWIGRFTKKAFDK